MIRIFILICFTFLSFTQNINSISGEYRADSVPFFAWIDVDESGKVIINLSTKESFDVVKKTATEYTTVDGRYQFYITQSDGSVVLSFTYNNTSIVLKKK